MIELGTCGSVDQSYTQWAIEIVSKIWRYKLYHNVLNSPCCEILAVIQRRGHGMSKILNLFFENYEDSCIKQMVNSWLLSWNYAVFSWDTNPGSRNTLISSFKLRVWFISIYFLKRNLPTITVMIACYKHIELFSTLILLFVFGYSFGFNFYF